jgi:acyl carrier protein
MPDNLTEEVLDVIAKTQRIPREKITLDGRFEELGMDSMDAVNILFALEEKFDITVPDEEAKKIRSIREMVEGVRKLVEAKSGGAKSGEAKSGLPQPTGPEQAAQ